MNDEHLIAVHRDNGVLVLVGTPRNNVMAKTSTASMTDHRETREPRTSSTVSTRPMWGLTVSLAMTRSSVISHPAATHRAARVTLGASASTELPASLCGRPCEEPAVEHQGLGGGPVYEPPPADSASAQRTREQAVPASDAVDVWRLTEFSESGCHGFSLMTCGSAAQERHSNTETSIKEVRSFQGHDHQREHSGRIGLRFLHHPWRRCCLGGREPSGYQSACQQSPSNGTRRRWPSRTT
jgi:hypothetical protein